VTALGTTVGVVTVDVEEEVVYSWEVEEAAEVHVILVHVPTHGEVVAVQDAVMVEDPQNHHGNEGVVSNVLDEVVGVVLHSSHDNDEVEGSNHVGEEGHSPILDDVGNVNEAAFFVVVH